MPLFSLTAAERRRLLRFREASTAMVLARGAAQPYAHVVWLGLAGALWLTAQAEALGWLVWPSLALFVALALILLYDALYFIIPDRLVLVVLLLGATTLPALDAGDALAHVAAAACGYGAFRLLDAGYARLRGRSGLGMGDAKLFGAAGLWLGVDGLASCLLVAVASALAAVVVARRSGAMAGSGEAFPFGPHLALGFWLAWAVGPIQAG